MQVTADAFALGGGRQPPDFVLRQLQGNVALLAQGLHVHHQPDNERHRWHPHHGLPRIAEVQRGATEQQVQPGQLQQLKPEGYQGSSTSASTIMPSA
ncbi:hypothetical protein G6F58_013226 [Rhizopus delemar]|nr:hypothetical protein G6F58_013226 [Rhizopus delemar]